MPANAKQKAHPKTNGKSQHTNKQKLKTNGKSHPPPKPKPKTQLQNPQKSKTKPPKKSNTKTQQPTALICFGKDWSWEELGKHLHVIQHYLDEGRRSLEFINTLAGNDALRVSPSTERETRRPLLVEVSPPHSKATIALLDTPGIDGDRPDSANKILKFVDAWLKRNHKGNVYFGGFLVLEESQAKDRPEPLSLLASVRCQSSLVLTKLGYGPHNNGHLHNSTNAIVFDPPTRERAWQIVNEILGRSTGAASERIRTGLVFKNILREIKKRKPSAMSRILAMFCIGLVDEK